MARGAPSPADLQVIYELAQREFIVTESQLESWRRAGLLPRHRRRGLGRGRGSVVDEIDPVVVDSAAVLARHLRQGRDRRLAVLEWFAEAGMPPQPGAAAVPEPPASAVREALQWAVSASPEQRLLETARHAARAGEEGQDALYAAAARMLAARPYRGAPHPGAVRAAFLADEDLPEGPAEQGVVHLVAAIGLGPQEVGADALAEGFAALGLYGLTAQDWARALQAAERGEGPPVEWGQLHELPDGLRQVERASDAELVRARTVLTGLRMFYGLYMLHGLLMPDTPGLAALRARIDERGMGPILDQIISLAPSLRQFADGLVACLGPMLDELYEVLMEQLTSEGPSTFHIPGDEAGAAGFMNTWIRTLREQVTAAGELDDGAALWTGPQPG